MVGRRSTVSMIQLDSRTGFNALTRCTLNVSIDKPTAPNRFSIVKRCTPGLPQHIPRDHISGHLRWGLALDKAQAHRAVQVTEAADPVAADARVFLGYDDIG